MLTSHYRLFYVEFWKLAGCYNHKWRKLTMATQFPFCYHTDILKRFPHLAGGAILAKGLKNGPALDSLQKAYFEEQSHVLAKIGSKPLSEIESLAGWRAAFRIFGVDPTQYRSAAEALLRRLTKKGDIPSINTIVDICNLVSIRYALPVAGFDMRAIKGVITVCFAKGDETFNPIGEAGGEKPDEGEVAFVDEGGLVVARRWCWRQSVESATREDTNDALFTIEAQHDGGKADVARAIEDLKTLLQQYAGGTFEIRPDVTGMKIL
jgi:DNA/RNA-binding domain of Phe-tRNA-synthetase-like protein